MGRQSRFPVEVRERAVRMVLEHAGGTRQWAAVVSIASKRGQDGLRPRRCGAGCGQPSATLKRPGDDERRAAEGTERGARAGGRTDPPQGVCFSQRRALAKPR